MTTVNFNPVETLQRQRRYFPRDEVMIYGEKTWTYAEFVDDVERTARAFAHRGVGRGDRVAYLGLNSSTFLTAMFAAWWIGAVYVPLNFRLAPREVEDLVRRAEPTVLLVEPDHADVVEAIESREALPEVTVPVLVDDDELAPASAAQTERHLPKTQFLAEAGDAAAEPELAVLGDDDLALLMFTSGTTGRPKGVQLSFGNVWWNSVNVDSLVDTRRGDTNLAVAPLFHIGGLNALTIRNMVRGGRTVVRRAFDPRDVLADIERHRVNQVFLVPAMLTAMQQVEEFEQHDISSMRALICAGAPVPPVLLRQYEGRGVDVQQAWGLTETAPFATYLPVELTHVKPGSCGMPMPYCEVAVMDPATGEQITDPERTGELRVRGPNVTVGYYQDEETTERAFEDGWFCTGDVGRVDEDGYFYIVDRLKDMIISGGENVYPAEVERVLAEYPGVQDLAVVGRPDERWGEVVVAVLSCSDGVKPTVEEVREFAAEHLARYKLPKEVMLTDDVSRNGAGKLEKNALRAKVAERSGQ